MLNVHASGGPAMLEAAREALAGIPDRHNCWLSPILTSMDSDQVGAVGIDRSPSRQVDLLARMSLAAGITGFVCSPQEVAAVRALAGPDGVLVTPGIRPAGSDTGDQRRVATPAESLRQGASYLVVGRPITKAADPAAAAEAVLREMVEAL